MVDIITVMKRSPVIPVMTVDDVETAVAMATSLQDGGLGVIEITNRTPVAVEALRAVKTALPDLYVGMGTVWEAEDVHEAVDAGAEFIVSPGIADAVGEACLALDVAYLPGAQTVSEIAHLARNGFTAAKLFPAGTIGGPSAVKAYAAVFPHMLFCPTGGVQEQTAADYLALPSVPCVGGTWLTRHIASVDDDMVSVRNAAQLAAQMKTA